MVSKKKKKIILFSLISILLIAVILISAVFVVKKNKNKNKNNSATPPATSQMTDTNLSNMAIADGKVSLNYQGSYIFNTIKTIEFSDELKEDPYKLGILFSNEGVKNENELFDKLKKDKVNAAKTGELIVISVSENENTGKLVGNINKTVNNIPVSGSAGTFVGDDNLSLVRLTNSDDYYYISLHYKSKDDAIAVSDKTASVDGTKLYVYERLFSKKDPDRVLVNIVYEYNLYVVDEIIDKDIYEIDKER